MIEQFSVKNLAKIGSLKVDELSKINVFVGENE